MSKDLKNNEKKEIKKVVISKEAQKQIDDQRAIEEAQKVLNDQIEKYNRKKQLIEHRETFLETKKDLLEILENQGVDFDHSLDNQEFQIVLKRQYHNDPLSIKNNLIVREFVEFAIKKIDIKLLEIENEILKG